MQVSQPLSLHDRKRKGGFRHALQAKLDSFITLCDEAVAARAVAEQATNAKAAGLVELTDAR